MRDQVISARVWIRYLHYDVMAYRFRMQDDCFSDHLQMFRENLQKYPGLAGAVGYGKVIRVDLRAWIMLEVKYKSGERTFEFGAARELIEFFRKNPEVGAVLGYSI